jgi:hypothetical protein
VKVLIGTVVLPVTVPISDVGEVAVAVVEVVAENNDAPAEPPLPLLSCCVHVFVAVQ